MTQHVSWVERLWRLYCSWRDTRALRRLADKKRVVLVYHGDVERLRSRPLPKSPLWYQED